MDFSLNVSTNELIISKEETENIRSLEIYSNLIVLFVAGSHWRSLIFSSACATALALSSDACANNAGSMSNFGF